MGNPADGPETKRDAEYLKNMKTGERTPNLQANLSAMGALRNQDPADGINQSVIDRLKAIKSGDPEEVKKKVADEVQAQYDREDEAAEGQITKDRELVDQMNKEARPMFSDPDYDLDDEGEELGEGAFGSVFMGPDGKSVIKEGQIGPEEMIAMMKLKDHPGFPTLINGRFERPFAPFSAYENNPGGRESGQRNTNWRGKPAYKNPEKASDFDDRFPGAQGRYAMSLAEGQTLDDYFYENGEEDAPEIFKNILKLRRDMHKTGIAHNDMHGGNIFVGDDGTPSIIDMGLAQDNPLAALMEGMGFVSGHDGQFNMGAAPGGMLNQVREFVNPDLMKKLTENRDQISRSLFRDEVDDEIDDWDDDDFDEMMGGGVRKTQDELEKLQRFIPRLKKDPEFVMSLIDRLYQGLDDDGDGVIEPEEIKKAEIGGFEGALGKLRGLGVGKVDNDD
jgi:hypothetical protein